jgi:hypothetical protein
MIDSDTAFWLMLPDLVLAVAALAGGAFLLWWPR